jgi:hypothetical protein
MSLSIGYGLRRISEDELQHHGIKGQKWGVRRFQSYDVVPRKSGKSGDFVGMKKYDSRKLKAESDEFMKSHQYSQNGIISRNPSDIVIKRGTQLERASVDSEDEFRDYRYVSINGYDYLAEVGGDRVLYYTNDKDLVIAGKKTVNDLLSKMGARTLDDRMDNDFDSEEDWLDSDTEDGEPLAKDQLNFMGNQKNIADREFAVEFAKKLKEMGYDGLFDPEDSAINKWDEHPTSHNVPMIIVDDVLRKTGEKTSDELVNEWLNNKTSAENKKKKKFLFF